MNLKSKKLLISAGLVSALAFPAIASAYSGSYSFDIAYSITGSTTHSLSSKPTSTTVKGNTYNNDGKIQASKSSYTVAIAKPLKSYTTSPISANGTTYNRSYGTISSGSYKVSVYKYSSTGARVKGSGTIDQ